MPMFVAHEFDANVKETGRLEFYPADDISIAVNSCLYTHRLKNGNAFIGATGRTVHAGEFSYAVVKTKKRPQ